MPTSPNEALARDIIPAQTGHVSESIASSHRKTWRFWTGACFAIVLLAAFARPLLALMNYAAGSELHSYILLVPFVSVYLLYLRRNQLPKNYTIDLPLAIVFLAAGLDVMAFTYSSIGLAPADNAHLVLLTLSFLCCLTAGGFFFFGRNWMRAAECSGIRSSWVLLMTSILAANLFLKTPWRRLALVAFVIPLGILRNGFRILVIGLLCVNAGPQMIHSLIHRRGGPLFFMLSLIPFFLVLWWLRKGDVHTRQPK